MGRRHGLDLLLLWLWYRPAAVAPIQPRAWKLPYAVGVALRSKKKKKKKEKAQVRESILIKNPNKTEYETYKC